MHYFLKQITQEMQTQKTPAVVKLVLEGSTVLEELHFLHLFHSILSQLKSRYDGDKPALTLFFNLHKSLTLITYLFVYYLGGTKAFVLDH